MTLLPKIMNYKNAYWLMLLKWAGGDAAIAAETGALHFIVDADNAQL
jgi:hypothetical protein